MLQIYIYYFMRDYKQKRICALLTMSDVAYQRSCLCGRDYISLVSHCTLGLYGREQTLLPSSRLLLGSRISKGFIPSGLYFSFQTSLVRC